MYMECPFGWEDHNKGVVKLDMLKLFPSECFKYFGSILYKSGCIDQDVNHNVHYGWLT